MESNYDGGQRIMDILSFKRCALIVALSILSTAAVASGLPRCPDDTNIRWNKCFSSKIFPNGDLYEGFFVGGKPSGKGSLTMVDGTKKCIELNNNPSLVLSA